MAKTWPAARSTRDEALQLVELGSVVSVSVFDDIGECVFESDRDHVNPPVSWSMCAPRQHGRYCWNEEAGYALTKESPEMRLAELVVEAGDWRSTNKWFGGKRSCPECGKPGWRQP